MSLKDRRKISGQLFLHTLLDNKIDSPQLLQLLNLYAPTARLRRRDIFKSNKGSVMSHLSQTLEMYNRLEGIDVFHDSFEHFKDAISNL